MNWKKRHIALGDLKVGAKKEITFIPEGELPEIDNMVSSCGCSIPKRVGNNIIVTYTPGAIPTHLYFQGFYQSKKTVTITYKDNTQDVLSFSATIKKK